MELLFGVVVPMFVAAIVWLVRLESKVQMNKRDIDETKAKMNKMEEIQNRQESILAGGTERFKHIDDTLSEIRQDIRKLLESHGK